MKFVASFEKIGSRFLHPYVLFKDKIYGLDYITTCGWKEIQIVNMIRWSLRAPMGGPT